jgi:hypothetical protein
MRTKILLASAAALVMGLASSYAQVYSANVVGYINIPLTNSPPAGFTTGFSLVANQLDLDGTGTNNSIYTVVGTNVPVNTVVEAWNGAGFSNTKWLASGKWSPNTQTISNAMNIGSGFFIVYPSSTTITEVGNVIQGTNTYNIVAGLQPVSSIAPISGLIDTNFNYHPSKNDQLEVWNGGGFSNHKWLGSSWSGGGDPTIGIGQAVFLSASSNNVWTQTFEVQ